MKIQEEDVMSLSVLLLMSRYITADQEIYDKWVNWVEYTTKTKSPGSLIEGRMFALIAISRWAEIQDIMKEGL